jgi:hypothetical protein
MQANFMKNNNEIKNFHSYLPMLLIAQLAKAGNRVSAQRHVCSVVLLENSS